MNPIVPAVNEEVDEFLSDLEITISINVEKGCYFICEGLEFDSPLSPCMGSQEDLEEWISNHTREIQQEIQRRQRHSQDSAKDFYRGLQTA